MITKNLDHTYHVASEFVKDIFSKKKRGKSDKGAEVVLLYGDLGSGKTAFVQGVAKYLGIKDKIISPTFVIEKIYKLPRKHNFKHLIHIDAYRLDSPSEMLALGWDDIVASSDNIIFVEWPEKINEILPPGAKKISFTFLDEERRKIEFN